MANRHSALRSVGPRLHPEHEAELHNIVFGDMMRKTTPDHIRDDLMKSGHIEQRLGGLVSTHIGDLYFHVHGNKHG